MTKHRTRIITFIISAILISIFVQWISKEINNSRKYSRSTQIKTELNSHINQNNKTNLDHTKNKTIKTHPSKNEQPIQQEVIESLSQRAIKLLEFPLPEIAIKIKEIKQGPASIKGIFKFKKNDELQIGSYLIASDSKNSEPKDWLDLGTFSYKVEDVNNETQLATITKRQIISGKTSMQSANKLTISGCKFKCKPNGEIDVINSINVNSNNKQQSATLKKNSSTTTAVIFPDYEIKSGQSWEIKNDNSKSTFKFEGYYQINGIDCMKITVDSNASSIIDYTDNSNKKNYKIKCDTHTTGVHYFNYKQGITQLSDLTTEIKKQDGLPQNNSKNKLAGFFRKVTYVKN